jgi:DNA-binding transcriptional ArsR family regulator
MKPSLLAAMDGVSVCLCGRRRNSRRFATSEQFGCHSMASRPLRHPGIESVTVADILHALADPTRLAIVSELREAESEMNCVETMSKAAVVLPKSTCSQHFQILREAGLIRCERKGVELSSRLRYRELEARFPGLLSAILNAYRKERRKSQRPA